MAFTPPPYSLKVIRDRVGRRLLELNELMWQGLVHHVDQFELWVVPTTEGEPRLLIVGRLPDGDTVVLETTMELYRAACRELEEH